MTRFCRFSLLVTSFLVLATGYAKAGNGLFEITCLGNCTPQPPVIPEGDQYMCIGSCFYMRPGTNAFINMTWIQSGSTATEESIKWYFNGVEIVFDVASVETFTENGRDFIRQRSLNYPTIFLLRESGVKKTEILNSTNVSKALSEGNYTAEIVLDNVVYASATSKLVVIPYCDHPPVDVCFVIDGSGSLGRTRFDEEREFVINIVNQLPSNYNRYCYAIFGSNITSSFVLTFDRAEFIRSLLAESYPGGGTNLSIAINYVCTNLFTNENRIDTRRRILFFLTDGRDDTGVESLRSKSTSLARKGVETIAIGFGVSIDRDQLRAIGLNRIFIFLNFQDANEKIGDITSVICRKPCCTGPAGYRGRTGIKGPSGDSGDEGVPGICDALEECYNFESSSAGSPGADGEKGETGPKGQTGEKGSVGMKGDRGRKGNNGEDGVNGQKGNKGLTGSDGVQGSDGQKGQDGESGIRGDKGATGSKGLKGQRGSQGICTTQSCVGDQGDKGGNGKKGQKGANGNRGNNGQKGLNGDKGIIGNTGDNGETGNKGSTGPTGDVIEIKDLVNQACSPSGKLYLDPATKKLYYCENGKYTCVSSNDTCEEEKPPCNCSSSNTNCGQFTRNTMFQACGNNVAVDFILVVDDTSSMDRQQDWLRTHLPDLEEKLKKRCIGNSTNFPNLYQIVAYGGKPQIGPGNNEGCDYANAEAPHFVRGCEGFCCQFSPPISNLTFPISGLKAATANLQNLGGFSLTGDAEVAYAALEFALDNAVLRNTTNATVIPAIILLSNGDADDYTEARFNSLLDRFVNNRPNMVFAFALNLGSFTTSNNLRNPFGAANNYGDGDLTVWHLPNDTANATRVSVPYGSVSSDVSSSVTPNNEFRNVDRDFIDLLMCSKRSSASFWDLDFVVNGDADDVTRFTDAFIRQNSDAIINRARLFNCRMCYCNASATEVCVFVENEQICNCLQDNPSSDCSCVYTRLQEIAQIPHNLPPTAEQKSTLSAKQSLILTPAQSNSILSYCSQNGATTPPSPNCKGYVISKK